MLAHASSKVVYGSAKIQGFVWEDYACINPLQPGLRGSALSQELKDKKCSMFQFLSLFKAEGLSQNADGILGLSPHKEMRKKKFHFLWSLKHNKIIDHAIVSFSVTKSTWSDKSYALFGGYNSS